MKYTKEQKAEAKETLPIAYKADGRFVVRDNQDIVAECPTQDQAETIARCLTEALVEKRVVIVVRGGCVVSVKASQKMEMEVIDCDNLKETASQEAIDQIINEACKGLEGIY